MKLTNRTPYRALLNRMVIGPDSFAAAVVARVTFDLAPQPVVAADQSWPFSAEAAEGPRGTMDGEGPVFYRGGVDVLVWGHARAAGGVPASHVDVAVEVGPWKRTVRVHGDRVWVKNHRSLVPGPAAPFRELPLSPEYAYGGRARWDGLDVPYPPNESGRGFYLTEEEAEGGALPNLEDPAAPIARWDEHPQPVGLGFCLLGSVARTRNGVELDEQGVLTALRPTLFNSAYPEMIAPRAEPGDRLRVSGVLAGGPLELTLPDVPLVARLAFEDEVSEHPLAIDQIGIEVDERRLFLSYRFPFRYLLVPQQRRSCELFVRGADRPGGLPR